MTGIRSLNLKLQTKTALYFVLGLLGVILSSLFIVRYFFLVSLDSLEITELNTASQQASSVLNMMIREQEEHSYDWAYWDETHNLLIGGDVEAYRERNLMMESLDALKLDLMIFINLHDDVVDHLARDSDDYPNLVPHVINHPSVSDHINSMNQVLDAYRDSISGLIKVDEQIWSISVTPVRNSEGVSASSGWLIWGQHISARFPGDYASILIAKNELVPLSVLETGTEIVSNKMLKTSNTIVNWNQLKGLSGEPIVALRSEIERVHYAKGNLLFLYLLASVIFTTTIIAVATFLLFRKKVATRFSDLERDIDDLFTSYQLEGKFAGNQDEFERLTHMVQILADNTSITQDRLNDTLQKFDALYHNRSIAMVLVRNREIIDVNQMALGMLDYRKDQILHQPLDILCPDQGQPECQVDMMYREFNKGKKHFEACVLTRSGEHVDCQIETTLIKHEGEDALMLSIHDLREKRQQQQLIEDLSERDYLSSLSNRRAILEKVDHAITETANEFSFIYVTMPRLKMVSEVFGHQIFDAAIKYIASVFHGCFSQYSIGRISVNEFVVLVPNKSEYDEAVICAQKLIDELSSKKPILGVELDLSCQAVIVDPEITHEPLDYLLQAAIYAVQSNQTPARVGVVGSEMSEKAKTSSVICRELGASIREEQICAYYQPIVEAKTGEVNGFEALARWLHPTLGMISPAVFIPLTEQNNLEIELGESIILQACRFIEQLNWQRKGSNHRPLTVHVNLSATHFYHSQLSAYLASAIAKYNVQPGQLVIEITESMLMGAEEEVISRMEEIKALGVQIALDDFGTGYSSFSTLCSFPFDIVKLDKSYIDQIENNDRAKTLVRNIAKMSQELGLTTVAEGVETASQARKIRNWNIEEIQGFHFYKPLPREEAMSIICE